VIPWGVRYSVPLTSDVRAIDGPLRRRARVPDELSSSSPSCSAWTWVSIASVIARSAPQGSSPAQWPDLLNDIKDNRAIDLIVTIHEDVQQKPRRVLHLGERAVYPLDWLIHQVRTRLRKRRGGSSNEPAAR
jgi:hypothetical protein